MASYPILLFVIRTCAVNLSTLQNQVNSFKLHEYNRRLCGKCKHKESRVVIFRAGLAIFDPQFDHRCLPLCPYVNIFIFISSSVSSQWLDWELRDQERRAKNYYFIYLLHINSMVKYDTIHPCVPLQKQSVSGQYKMNTNRSQQNAAESSFYGTACIPLSGSIPLSIREQYICFLFQTFSIFLFRCYIPQQRMPFMTHQMHVAHKNCSKK